MTTFDQFLCGEMQIEGRMPWSSNATFLVRLLGESALPGEADDATAVKGIYKPWKGERPLWDYPTGLYKREAAASALSDLLGWNVVPRTVVREGPHGVGSVQSFIDAAFEEHYFTIKESRPELDADLRRLAAFDLLANSGDRKSGHVLIEGVDSDHPAIWAIDNGLSFHEEEKLRTVIWDYGGDTIDPTLVVDIARIADADLDQLDALVGLLSPDELDALRMRAYELVETPQYPYPDSRYSYPWPMV